MQKLRETKPKPIHGSAVRQDEPEVPPPPRKGYEFDFCGYQTACTGRPPILRVFAEYLPGEGYPPECVASMAKGMVRLAFGIYKRKVQLVVLPAGTIHLPKVEVDAAGWRTSGDSRRRAVAPYLDRVASLMKMPVPMLVGVDGDIVLRSGASCAPEVLAGGLQSMVMISGAKVQGFSLKSLPASPSEREGLGVALNQRGSPVPTAFAENQARLEFNDSRLMSLVCHDAIGFERRGAAAAARNPSGWSHRIRTQMKKWLKSESPEIAVNAIHLLPSRPYGRISPGFLNAHSALAARGLHVVAVCGTLSRSSARVEELARRLRSDFPTVNAHLRLMS